MSGRVAARDPQVSVIVPGHNAAHLVADTMTSIGKQLSGVERLEVIYVDDGSTDGSAELVASLPLPGVQLTVLRNRRSTGVSAARNRGLAQARGEFIAFCDADDWFAPGHLGTLVAEIERLDCDFVRTDLVQAFGSERTLIRAPQWRRGQVLAPKDSILPVAANSMVDHPSVSAGLYRRALLDQGLLRFDESLASAEDRHLIWRLHLEANSYAVVDAPGVFYRRGLVSSLTQVLDSRRLGYLAAFDDLRQRVVTQQQGALFAAKLIQTVLALTAQHLARTPDDAALVAGAQALVRRFPQDLVEQCASRLDDKRTKALALVLPQFGAQR